MSPNLEDENPPPKNLSDSQSNCYDLQHENLWKTIKYHEPFGCQFILLSNCVFAEECSQHLNRSVGGHFCRIVHLTTMTSILLNKIRQGCSLALNLSARR